MRLYSVAFDTDLSLFLFSFPPIVHKFNIFINLQHLQPLSAHKRLLFSSKAENETNIVFYKSLETWSSPLLSDIGSQRSFQGPLIKEHVAVHIFDGCTCWAKTHRLHLSRRPHEKHSLDATRWYWGKNCHTQAPKINPHTFQGSLGLNPLVDIWGKVRDTQK